MSHPFYRWLHVVFALSLLFSLGGYVMLAKLDALERKSLRARVTIIHGVSLLLLLVSGFGLIARLQIRLSEGVPLWIVLKLVLWLFFGASISILKKKPQHAGPMAGVLLGLGAAITYLCIYKPG